MRQHHRGAQEADSLAKPAPEFPELRQACRNLVTVTPLGQVPNEASEAEPQGNAMSVRITAAGAVAFATLSFLTTPVSACDERYIQKCERAARAWRPAQLGGLFQPRPASCTAGFRFCRNCARLIYVFTRKNTPFMIRYWSSGTILSQRVTRRGRGIYGTANPTTGAYQPKPGYTGKDYFEVEVSYERSGTKLKTTLQANVTITD